MPQKKAHASQEVLAKHYEAGVARGARPEETPNKVEKNWIDDAVANLPPLVTVEELVALLRTSRRQVYRLISSGRIQAVKQSDGGSSRNLVPRAGVHKYLSSLEVE